jgi:hypothetical protein
VAAFEFRYSSDLESNLLFAEGPLVRVSITAPTRLIDILHERQMPPYAVLHGLALIDTGAAVSAVDVSVFEELDIPAVDTMLTRTPHGLADLNLYNASACLTDLAMDRVPLDRVPGGHFRSPTESGPDVIMLLGRDVLRQLKFTYDGPKSRITLET